MAGQDEGHAMLTVQALMTGSPTTASLDTSLRVVLACMNKDGCRHVPVVKDELLVGIVSERDIRLALDSPVLDPGDSSTRIESLEQLTAGDCMTTAPVTVTPSTSAHEAADMLRLYKFGALPVVEDGRLVGILTTVDYLKHFATRPGEQS